MKNLPHHLATLLTTAWVGGLWAIGYLAAPVLFSAQPDKQLAGMLAGQMFSWISYAGMVCGAYLLTYHFIMFNRLAAHRGLFWLVICMLFITLLLLYGIQPMMADLKLQALPADVMNSAFADRFKSLHGISQIFYLLQSLLGAFLLIKTNRT